jgi:hypothetical protein
MEPYRRRWLHPGGTGALPGCFPETAPPCQGPKVRIHLPPAGSHTKPDHPDGSRWPGRRRKFPTGQGSVSNSSARLTGTSGADAGIVDQDVEPIRRRLDRTKDLVRPRRALARCCSSRSSPRRPCKIRTTYMFSWLVIMFGRVDPDEPVIRGRDQSSRPIEVHPIAGRSVLGFAGQWMVATADIEDPNAILRI